MNLKLSITISPILRRKFARRAFIATCAVCLLGTVCAKDLRPIEFVTATSASPSHKEDPRVIVNGVGLNGNGHDNGWKSTWTAAQSSGWVVIDLGAAYPVRSIRVWNFNANAKDPRSLNWGAKDVRISVSPTAEEEKFAKLLTGGSGSHDNGSGDFTFPMANHESDYKGFVLDLGGVKNHDLLAKVRLVKVEILSSWGGQRVGISEMRFETDANFKAVGAPTRPPTALDLTNGGVIPGSNDPRYWTRWNIGATGMVGRKALGNGGDQVLIAEILPGSPAEGKVLVGDVLLGVQGQDFRFGGNLNVEVGNAIIKAEEEAGGGRFEVRLWRPGGSDGKGTRLVENLKLKTMGTYSDTSPFDCPVADKIRKEAWAHVAGILETELRTGNFKDRWRDVLALVASAQPEHLALARRWVHAQKLETDMGKAAEMLHGDKVTWASGFSYLEMALYADATGDNIVLPEVRLRALQTAMGQNESGTWAHNFTWGNYPMMPTPPYGCVNATGGPCFMLLAMAHRLGIREPLIEEALEKSKGFFSTFVNRGAVPYGIHWPLQSEDNNGKNYGPAYAFYALGELDKAKFFAMDSAVASFLRFGGHGSPVMWYNSPITSHIAGPRGITESMHNMRYHYTLARRHDGSFVLQGEQYPGIDGAGSRASTATTVLHYSLPMKGTMITGKDAKEKAWMTDEEFSNFRLHAKRFVVDPALHEKYPDWGSLDADGLLAAIGHQYPILRAEIATRLGKLHTGGQTEIFGKLIALLTDPDPRKRAGACIALRHCGAEQFINALPSIEPLFTDPEEFVRIDAAYSAAAVLPFDDKRLVRLLLTAVADDAAPVSRIQTANIRAAVSSILFPKRRGVPTDREAAQLKAPVATDPFGMGMDRDLVRTALGRLAVNESEYIIPDNWSRDTVIELAGPLMLAGKNYPVYAKEGRQGAAARALLAKHGFREAYETDAELLRIYGELGWQDQRDAMFRESMFTPAWILENPGAYKHSLPALYVLLRNHPEDTGIGTTDWTGVPGGLAGLIARVEAADADAFPSVAPEAAKIFERDLVALPDMEAKITFCRKVLEGDDKPYIFRKAAAMRFLSSQIGPAAIDAFITYLGHPEYHLRQAAKEAAAEAVKSGKAEHLQDLYLELNSRMDYQRQARGAAALLEVMADHKVPAVLSAAKHVLSSTNPHLQAAAVSAIVKLQGTSGLDTLLEHIRSVRSGNFMSAFERTVLSPGTPPAFQSALAASLRKNLATFPAETTANVAWILSQLGGSENIDAVVKMINSAATPDLSQQYMHALAFSPDKEADNHLVSYVQKGNRSAQRLIVHRLVAAGSGDSRPAAQKLQLIRGTLATGYQHSLANYLISNYASAEAVEILMLPAEIEMKRPEDVMDYYVIQQVNRCAETVKNPTPQDSARIAACLNKLVTYLEWKIKEEKFITKHTRHGVPWMKNRQVIPIKGHYEKLLNETKAALGKFPT